MVIAPKASSEGACILAEMGDCDYGVGGDCNGMSAGIRVIYTGPKSGGKLITLFDSGCDDAVSAGIWVIR